MVPPTFPKVWKPVSECYFKELKSNAAYPAHQGVTDNHHFEPPTQQVGDKVNIYCRIINVSKAVHRVFWSVQPTIFGVALLRERLSKF